MNLLFVAIIVNSALYIAMVFVAGLVTHNQPAYILAIVTAGVCYLSYMGQVVWPEQTVANGIAVMCSAAFGIAAGLSLLIGG